MPVFKIANQSGPPREDRVYRLSQKAFEGRLAFTFFQPGLELSENGFCLVHSESLDFFW